MRERGRCRKVSERGIKGGIGPFRGRDICSTADILKLSETSQKIFKG